MEEHGTAQTTFTEGGEGTVNITGPSGSTTVPSVDFVEDPNDLLPDVLNDSFDTNSDDIEDRLSKLEKVLRRPSHSREEKRLRKPGGTTLNDGTEVLMFRSEQGINKCGTQIMKRGKTSIPTYSKNSTALREYKELVRKIREEPSTSTHEGDDESVTTVVDQGAALNNPGG
ncbi:Hypothetical predicted protein [Paramuricea clavata]|uniref:Uncharacterized protein n=1 Tax=Paramuricea clavata TaxID=317549 RepID=A0A6S7HKK0_PARCT|nr:Hypothetical predicted protein [Paramuricea clavata]